MATKTDERGWIAYHLYEESRLDRIVEKPSRYDDEPMWMDLSEADQRRWMNKAARLQDWLTTCRRFQRG